MTPQPTISVPGGLVWAKRVRPAQPSAARPLLVVHGGPGLPHYYLSALERLSDEREVIFWDQLGCGNSQRPADRTLWTMPRSVAEMASVITTLRLSDFHVFGNSWGAMLALQYLLDAPGGVRTLTLSNSAASIPVFAANVIRLKADLDWATRDAIDRHEAAGTTGSAAYRAAVTTWNQTHLCRRQPWPDDLYDAFADMGTEIFETMFGPSVFRIVGTMRDWDVVDRLGGITTPTLLLAARYDEFPPEHMREMHRRIQGSSFEFFEHSAHLPFIEEPERFDALMRDFLRRHD